MLIIQINCINLLYILHHYYLDEHCPNQTNNLKSYKIILVIFTLKRSITLKFNKYTVLKNCFLFYIINKYIQRKDIVKMQRVFPSSYK